MLVKWETFVPRSIIDQQCSSMHYLGRALVAVLLGNGSCPLDHRPPLGQLHDLSLGAFCPSGPAGGLKRQGLLYNGSRDKGGELTGMTPFSLQAAPMAHLLLDMAHVAMYPDAASSLFEVSYLANGIPIGHDYGTTPQEILAALLAKADKDPELQALAGAVAGRRLPISPSFPKSTLAGVDGRAAQGESVRRAAAEDEARQVASQVGTHTFPSTKYGNHTRN